MGVRGLSHGPRPSTVRAHRSDRGFTFLELLVVPAIIALAAAVDPLSAGPLPAQRSPQFSLIQPGWWINLRLVGSSANEYRARLAERRGVRKEPMYYRVPGWGTTSVRQSEFGFTLLELLVVLAIIALAAGLIAPALVVAPRPPKPELISFLEEQRRYAIESGTAVNVIYDDNVLIGTPDRTSFEFSEGQRLDIDWPSETGYLKERLVTVFYPDGTAMLGRFGMVRATSAGREVEVLRVTIHPIFGKVIYAFP